MVDTSNLLVFSAPGEASSLSRRQLAVPLSISNRVQWAPEYSMSHQSQKATSLQPFTAHWMCLLSGYMQPCTGSLFPPVESEFTPPSIFQTAGQFSCGLGNYCRAQGF